MSTIDTGFSWGIDKSGGSNKSNGFGKLKHNDKYKSGVNPKKRSYDDHFRVNKQKSSINNHNHHNHHKNISVDGSSYINKRTKVPIIKGEKLPINRLIECLSGESINNLLSDLVQIHPEIVKTIYDLKPKVPIEDCKTIVSKKVLAIRDNLPYKGDLENDYSYLRVKPYLNEFLNCLSDFILNVLPPIETNFFNSLEFIDFTTSLINDLPTFNNSEYKYIISKCYEQLSNTWLIILNNLCEDQQEHNEEKPEESNNNDIGLYKFIKIVNDLNLKDHIMKYNEMSNGKFDKIIEFVDGKFSNYNNLNSELNDLITIDYSNYSLTTHSSG